MGGVGEGEKVKTSRNKLKKTEERKNGKRDDEKKRKKDVG